MGPPRTGLARRRRAVGLSQDALADRLSVDRTTISRWERGATEPQLTLRCRLANVLDISLDDLNTLLSAPPPTSSTATGPPEQPPTGPVTESPDHHTLVDDAVNGLRSALLTARDEMHRRALLRLTGTLGLLGAAPDLLERLTERGTSGPVDGDLVEALDAVTHAYGALAMQAPPAATMAPVARHLRRIEARLEQSMSPTHRVALLRMAGETAALQGWFANGAGRDDAADVSYARARAFARETEERLLEANICGLQASLHSRIVRGEVAHSPVTAGLLDIGLALAPMSAHRTRQWLLATRAFEHAAQGEADRFAALSAAAASEPDGQPVSSGFFTASAFFASWNPQFVGKFHGLGLMALERPDDAARSLREALQSTEENVSRGTLLADLAAACALSGDVEQACGHAEHALDVVGDARPRTIQRVRGARRLFRVTAATSAVVEALDGRLWATAAPAAG